MRKLIFTLGLGISCLSGACVVDSPQILREDSGVLSFDDASEIPDANAAVIDSGRTASDAGVFADAQFSMDAAPPLFVVPDCIEATLTSTRPLRLVLDPRGRVTVTVQGQACEKSYNLETTQDLRDPQRPKNRSISEDNAFPVLRSGNELFDALYALAVAEMKENAVAAISDPAFNQGQPITCPSGGCFETGALWHYIWTRDIAYAADLGLAALDPIRVKNALEFKLSERKSGGDLQIVQDTGTGGSYPVSTDRVVWALGAIRTLHFLEEPERSAFEARAREAINNTLAQDRVLIFDEETGLYRGESSFLDWREQSYPEWMKDDAVHIGMSKSLSTNVLHFRALQIASSLNQAAGEQTLAGEQTRQAQALKIAIDQRFSIQNVFLYGAFLPTTLDSAPSQRFDLLGTSLAIISDVSSSTRSEGMLSSFPHTAFGAPVIWPAQKDVPIYHNRALWPFVTAYWLRAARHTENAAALNHNFDGLVRAAALNLSNMENLEFTSGLPWVDDGDLSGPVVNSRRQLWSVAAYFSAIHEQLFGLETSMNGIRFQPMLNGQMRATWFPSSERIVLNRFRYRGKHVHVELLFPPPTSLREYYSVASVQLNGQEIADRFIEASELEDSNWLRIQLMTETSTPSPHITVLPPSSGQEIYAPSAPVIRDVALHRGEVRIRFRFDGESDSDIEFNIYRDGLRLVSGLAGDNRDYVETSSLADQTPSYCYSVEAVKLSSGLVSQRSKPSCFWGNRAERIWSVYADDFSSVGGLFVDNHGRRHYQDWGASNHEIRISNFVAQVSGRHWLQTIYGNGSGPVSTGITCAVKRMRVFEVGTQALVSTGYINAPQLGDWTQWKDGSFVLTNLQAGMGYDFVLDQDDYAVNMSFFAHFSNYSGGAGGGASPYNYVNVSEVRILSLSPL